MRTLTLRGTTEFIKPSSIRYCLLSFLVLGSLCLGACSNDDGHSQARQVSMIEITEILRGGLASNGEFYGAEVAELDAQLFSEYYNRYADATEVDIDFEDNRLVYVNAGSRSSGGYSIEIAEVKEFDEESVEISIIIWTPDPSGGCVYTMAFTEPFLFVLLNTEKELILNEEERIQPCP